MSGGVPAESAPAENRLVRVAHPALSLWQSAVRQAVANSIAAGDINDARVATDSKVREADQLAQQQAEAGVAIAPRSLHEVEPSDNLLEIALAHAHDVAERIGLFAESIGKFDSLDPLFLECVLDFVKYYWLAHRRPQYRDWKAPGRGLAFGLLEQPIPRAARVAIIGDWGTGLPDAEALLRELLATIRPDVLIHLGDVYYSGTPLEAQHNFVRRVSQSQQAAAARNLRTYTIPGNHDYYAGGAGFYQTIDGLNSDQTRQAASYFCLRTEDGALQFLGMDTGYNDRDPGIAFDRAYIAPLPQESELEWLADKLDTFPGSTVLLSHHQPFSAHSALNGPESNRQPFVNQPLIDAFAARLDRVPMWFWGHEHNLVLFGNDQFGVARGRLVGCSAFETDLGDDPYVVNFPQISVQPPRLSRTGPWYNHGCALVDLGERSVTYFQMAAWTGQEPLGVKLEVVASEALPI